MPIKIDYSFKDLAKTAETFGGLAHYTSECLREVAQIHQNATSVYKEPGYVRESVLPILHDARDAVQEIVNHLTGFLYAAWVERVAGVQPDIKAVRGILQHVHSELLFAVASTQEYLEVEASEQQSAEQLRNSYAAMITWAVYRACHFEKRDGVKGEPVAYLDRIGSMIQDLG